MRCPHGIWIGACVTCKPIHTPADQAWRNFRYTFKPGDTREIHSKRQFERACKQTGQRVVCRDDLVKRGVPYNPDPTVVEVPREAVATAIRQAQRSATPSAIDAHCAKQQAAAHA